MLQPLLTLRAVGFLVWEMGGSRVGLLGWGVGWELVFYLGLGWFR